MAGKKAEAVNASPGRLTAAVDACTRENGAESTAFFVGCTAPSWPSQSATETRRGGWPVAEPAERWPEAAPESAGRRPGTGASLDLMASRKEAG